MNAARAYVITLPGRKWLYSAGCLYLLGALTMCCFYLFHTRDYLQQWYLALNPCIYRRDNWESHFFTDAVKSAGNRYCLIALPLAGLLFAYLANRFRRSAAYASATIRMQSSDCIAIVVILLATVVTWLYDEVITAPSYDEVFSALNCAGAHPFQTLSYYMLPNNHVFFNLLNNLLFHYCGDQVLTGRIISLGAMLLLGPLLYSFLKKLTGRWLPAMLIVLILLLHFPVAGFAVQGRGYAIYLLCHWAALIYLMDFLAGNRRRNLALYTLANIVGFITIPSYLYFYTALSLVATGHFISRKDPAPAYWRYAVISWLIIFLFYLPALCFSGLNALAGNDYVAPVQLPGGEIAGYLRLFMTQAVQYCFNGYSDDRDLLRQVLFFLPLLLFCWYRRQDRRFMAFIYPAAWLSFFAICMIMRRWPFIRNLIGYYSLTVACAALTVYWLLERADGFMPRKSATGIFFPALAVATAVLFIAHSRQYLNSELYFYNTADKYRTVNTTLRKLPAGSEIGFAAEGFYWKYAAQRAGFRTADCFNGHEAYFIRLQDEPEQAPAGYVQADTAMHYIIYRRSR